VNPKYPIVAARSGHICEYCQAPETLSNMAFEVDHIIPISRCGTDEPDNLALSCRICNLRKSDHIDGIDPESQQTTNLFHPRRDIWTDHFKKQPYQIIGKTPIGRATIVRLDINSPLQQRARKFWVSLGMFSLD
jgi:HNH endonuclease